MCFTSNALSAGGKYKSVDAGITIALASMAPSAFTKSPWKTSLSLMSP